MSIKPQPYQTWLEFKGVALPQLFAPGIPGRGQFYFRGQGSEKLPLKSSFDRWFEKHGDPKLGKKASSEHFLQMFKDEASRLTPDPGLSSHEQLLGLAQHYGVPTRLLDWTESPYVAAFFAFSGIATAPAPGENVAIWYLDTSSSLWREDTGIQLLSIASPYNERLKNQLGKFTLLQSPFNTVEEHIVSTDRSQTVLRQITLPATEARFALSDLDFMGINYSTIYPGLDGCARAANLRMLLNAIGT